MADILKSFTSNLIRFAGGERPSADKFNAMVSYFSRGMSDISRAIGDIYDGSREELLHSAVWNPTSGQRRNIDILNLARIIGPASNLNARMLDLEVGKTVKDIIPIGTKEYELNYELNNDNVLFLSGNLRRIHTHVFTNKDEYYYDRENNSIVFAKSTIEEINLFYNTKPNEYFGGINYAEAGFNVIPDPNLFVSISENVDNAKLKITPNPNQDGYIIDLPLVYSQQSGLANDQQYKQVDIINQEEYNYLSEIQLPKWMHELEDGDPIPLNSLYVKDLTLGEAYLTADYFYRSPTRIEMKNASLCLDKGNKFVIVTVATDITTSIDDLRLKWFRHTHDGTFGEERINIKNLAGIFVKEHLRLFVPSLTFSKSSIEDNHLPMYLHRIGYSTDSTTNNGDNSMLGTLLMGRINFDYQDIDNEPVQSKDGVSHQISFGGIGDAAPAIQRDIDSNLEIRGQITPKENSDVSPDINLVSYENINSNASNNIINEAENFIKERANQIYDDYKDLKNIRLEKENGAVIINKEYSYEERNTYDWTTNEPNISGLSNVSIYDITQNQKTTVFNYENFNLYKKYEKVFSFEPTVRNNLNTLDINTAMPQLNMVGKQFDSNSTIKWLTTDATISDGQSTVFCPSFKYEDLNIQEFIIPIKEDSFEFNYFKEVTEDLSDLSNYPWVGTYRTDTNELDTIGSDETNVVSFGVLHENLADDANSISYSLINDTDTRRVYSNDFTSEQVEIETQVPGLTPDPPVTGYLKYPIRSLTLNKIGDQRRSFNVIKINDLFKNNTFGKGETAIQSNTDRIRLTKINSSTPSHQYYYECVFINSRSHYQQGEFNSSSSDSRLWKTTYVKKYNALSTNSNFSIAVDYEQSDIINPYDYGINFEPLSMINESFGIKVINNNTNKVYWLKGKFLNNSNKGNDTNTAEGQIYNDESGIYSYYVHGNTIRFDIHPNHIGLTNVNQFDINNFDIYIQYGFESNYNQHEKLDDYYLLLTNQLKNNDSSPYTHPVSNYYLKQINNNSFYLNLDNWEQKNILKYADYRTSIKYNDNENYYRGLTSPILYSDLRSYFPVPEKVKLTSFGCEYVHVNENNELLYNKNNVERYNQLGCNSQYLRFIRKVNSFSTSTMEYHERKFEIKCSKGTIRLGYVLSNLMKKYLNTFVFNSSDSGLGDTDENGIDYTSDFYDVSIFRGTPYYKKIIDQEDDVFVPVGMINIPHGNKANFYQLGYKDEKTIDKIKILSMPNFLLEYQRSYSSNQIVKRNKNDFFFENETCYNQQNDSNYLPKIGTFAPQKIIVKVNGKQYEILKNKDTVNISLSVVKYINDNFDNLFTSYLSTYLVKKDSDFRTLSSMSNHNEFSSIDLFFDGDENYDSRKYLQKKYIDKYISRHLSNMIFDLEFSLEIKEKVYADKVVVDINCNITDIEIKSDDVY